MCAAARWTRMPLWTRVRSRSLDKPRRWVLRFIEHLCYLKPSASDNFGESQLASSPCASMSTKPRVKILGLLAASGAS